MKRHLVPCLALSASLILTGCSSGQTHEETLLSQAAGIASDAAVLSVDGRDVPAWQVLYWLAYACDYIAASYEDGAIQWNEELKVAQKCTMCAHLLDDGWTEPRCVQACPIRPVDSRLVEQVLTENDRFFFVKDLEQNLARCADQWALPGELGIRLD